VLARGASLELERGRGDVPADAASSGRTPAAAYVRARRHGRDERLKRGVSGNDLRQIGKRGVPVKARGRQLADGVGASLRELLKLRVGVETGNLSLHLRGLLLEARKLRLAAGDGVAQQDVGRHDSECD